jgi:hypothetical protein
MADVTWEKVDPICTSLEGFESFSRSHWNFEVWSQNCFKGLAKVNLTTDSKQNCLQEQ